MPRESEIIARLRARAGGGERVILGIGDDAALLENHPEADLIACCDLSVEGVHFRLDWGTPRRVGRKALAVTLSDVAAMGGRPRYAMISAALPRAATNDFIAELFEGIFEMAEAAGVGIIGGDTSASPGPLFIDTTALGECARGRAIRRSGAQVGDVVYVTGELGASALGLSLLERGERLSDTQDAAVRQALLKHLEPEPRLAAGLAIGEAGLATAMIDLSDGLSTDLGHILEESGRGAVIRAAALPIADSVRALAAAPLSLALHGGEEYELIFTARPAHREPIAALSQTCELPITEIGEIVPEGGLRLERNGRLEEVRPSGFEHRMDSPNG